MAEKHIKPDDPDPRVLLERYSLANSAIEASAPDSMEEGIDDFGNAYR